MITPTNPPPNTPVSTPGQIPIENALPRSASVKIHIARTMKMIAEGVPIMMLDAMERPNFFSSTSP